MRLVEVRVNTTRKGEENDIKAWEQSNRSAHSLFVADTREKDEAEDTGCVCGGGHVVSTQVGRSILLKVLK